MIVGFDYLTTPASLSFSLARSLARSLFAPPPLAVSLCFSLLRVYENWALSLARSLALSVSHTLTLSCLGKRHNHA